VNYSGSDGVIYTAFEVALEGQEDVCRQSAELVLGTLRSVTLIEATPVTDP
jgi:hypothetical protein